MNKKKIVPIGIMVLILVMFAGCVPNDGTYTVQNPAGFFWGIWHGWIAPVSLIMGLLNKTTRIYEVANTGLGYDFGFYMAIISGFGGLSLFRRKKND